MHRRRMDKQKIDIITINLNNKAGLEKTIESVLSQTAFNRINYIIIDGGSTDGSRELIEEYQDKLFYWISEKDKGIYNAMNKGLRQATSEYCLFLNSGDYLSSVDCLEKALKYLDGTDILYGNEIKEKVLCTTANRDPFEWCKHNPLLYDIYSKSVIHHKNRKPVVYPDVLTEEFFMNESLPHQSTFINTELLKQHPYEEKYKIISDWKFLREAWKSGCTYKHIPVTVSVFNLDGFSSHNLDLMWEEKKKYYKGIKMKFQI